MEQIIFYVIVGIIIFEFLISRLMDYLNATRWTDKLPDEVKDIYDQEKYTKQQRYERESTRFGIITESFSMIIILLMLFFDGFAFVDEWVREYTSHPILMALLFFAVLFIVLDILTMPFSWYDTFIIEERYGFNKTTPKTFITDKIKGWALTAIIGGGLLSLLIWFFHSAGAYFWLYAWGLVVLFSVFMLMFYSNLIVPLFNKQTPLEEGSLRSAIEDFSKKAGFQLKNIYVIDGSKRSTKANAYFTGLGPKKRIVLFDTLINEMDNDEILSVLSHEIGHYKKKHILTSLFISIMQTGVMFFLLGYFLNNEVLSHALGAEEHSFHLGLIAFGILYSPLSTLIGIFMNMLSRKNEYEADAYAVQKGLGDALVSALKKLSVKNLSNLRPHPAYVFINYSHPTLLQRIAFIKEKQKPS